MSKNPPLIELSFGYPYSLRLLHPPLPVETPRSSSSSHCAVVAAGISLFDSPPICEQLVVDSLPYSPPNSHRNPSHRYHRSTSPTPESRYSRLQYSKVSETQLTSQKYIEGNQPRPVRPRTESPTSENTSVETQWINVR